MTAMSKTSIRTPVKWAIFGAANPPNTFEKPSGRSQHHIKK